MISDVELAKELASLKEQMGTVIKNRACIPIDSGERQYIFKTLIETLKIRYNMVESDFDSAMILRMVQEASVNPNSDKLRGWKQAVADDWFRALASKFPRQIIAHDPSTEFPKQEYKRSSGPEYVDEDPRLKNEKPIDRSIFEGLPEVIDPVDEDFMKQLEGTDE